MEPLRVQSLKDACVQRLEGLILSGEWRIGMRLPAERDLATQLNISRPVLHEALVDLASKGLVTIEPRRGVFINDYRTSGSCTLLSSLLSYSGGQLDPEFIRSLMAMRMLMETESAALAAINRTDANLAEFDAILEQEKQGGLKNGTLVALDFSFHLLTSISSGNLVYPLIINSFKAVYTHITGQFFEHYTATPVVDAVFAYHRRLVEAIAARQSEEAAAAMQAMLQHGADHLSRIPSQS